MLRIFFLRQNKQRDNEKTTIYEKKIQQTFHASLVITSAITGSPATGLTTVYFTAVVL